MRMIFNLEEFGKLPEVHEMMTRSRGSSLLVKVELEHQRMRGEKSNFFKLGRGVTSTALDKEVPELVGFLRVRGGEKRMQPGWLHGALPAALKPCLGLLEGG